MHLYKDSDHSLCRCASAGLRPSTIVSSTVAISPRTATLTRRLAAVMATVSVIGLCSLANIVQIMSLISLPFGRQYIFYLSTFAAGIIWRIIQHTFECINEARIEFSKDIFCLPEGESALVISNHCASADFYLIHAVAHRKKMLPYCKYFVKVSIRYIPIFGWGMWMMGMIFLKRDWSADRVKMDEAFHLYSSLRLPAWMISFPEGSRLSKRKLSKSHHFGLSWGYPRLQNVLLPRTKGFVASVKSLQTSHIQAVYDFTIAYDHDERGFGAAPTLGEIHSGRMIGYRFHVHAKRYPLKSLPLDDEERLATWIRERYYEKDQYLEALKQRWAEESLGKAVTGVPDTLSVSSATTELSPLEDILSMEDVSKQD